MKPVIFIFGIFFFFVINSNAQILVPGSATASTTPHNKVDRALNRANGSMSKANDAVNNTSTTATNSVTTLGKAKAFAKKMFSFMPCSSKNAKLNTTLIKVKGASFGVLKKLDNNVQSCSGVKTAKMKFSSSSSTITVTHKGTSTALLKSLEKRSRDLFKDANVDDFKEGNISIKLN